MHRLRNAHTLARLILAWFVLSLGVAMASPLAGSQNMMLVCTGSGPMQFAPSGGDDGSAPQAHPMACPLCTCVAARPPAGVAADTSRRLSFALQGIAAARLAARTAAPLPARGPPHPT